MCFVCVRARLPLEEQFGSIPPKHTHTVAPSQSHPASPALATLTQTSTFSIINKLILNVAKNEKNIKIESDKERERERVCEGE